MLLRLLLIAALAALVIPVAAVSPGAHADGGDGDMVLPVPEKTQLVYPKLGSMLDQLVAEHETGDASARTIDADDPSNLESSVAVTIYLIPENVDAVVSFLEDNGGSPRNVGEDYIEAYVPASLLGQTSQLSGVLRVREITPPHPAQSAQAVTGHGPPAHGSVAWNRSGYRGDGIKVGLIDVGFEGIGKLMGIELPATVVARCYTDVGVFTQILADCENDRYHGTLVAESIIDIAPEVSLYIANPNSSGDLRNTVEWMISENVLVINHSRSWTFSGPGDGTSPYNDSPLKTVDRAVAAGIIWTNAAGNNAESTWFGTYSNPEDDDYINFNGTDETIDLQLLEGDSIRVQLRWDDSWDGANRDFDLGIWDFATEEIVAYSLDLQEGDTGQTPYERLVYVAPSDGQYGVFVSHDSGTVPDWLQVTVWGTESIEHYTENGSIGSPAESANPGMLAVGAAPWHDTTTIQNYSSRGPTPDGRVKPDIIGADCGATALFPLDESNNAFCGTSQSSAHVAGLAALVLQRFPNLSPVEAAAYLKDNADQRESPDPNNNWGHGFAQLPPPPAEVACINNPGIASDCRVLLAARDSLAENATLNWSANTPVDQWEGVALGGTPLRVTGLILPEKALTGQIPSGLGSLTNLRTLSLWGNQLTGTIPPELGNLANLEVLSPSQNQLTGSIPPELGNLTKLRILRLWGNELTGTIPAELSKLTNLRDLSLSQNRLTGTIPALLGSLANLQWLYLSGNELTGTIPAELASLTKLDRLYLSDNQLTGTIPAELASRTSLEQLVLWGNELTGTIPTELGNLANLEVLALSQNQLTGGIPPELGNLANLRELYLSETELTGTIPTELGSLANLEALGLSQNQLTGTIPTELGNLANLEVLALSQNQLTGTIPAELASLTKLKRLYLWGNQLTGTIPTEVGNLANLEVLSLSQNQLTGTIPAWLGNLAILEVLGLSQNQLTGTIPPELASLTNLEWLVLWGNELTGPIPDRLGNLANLELLSLGGNQLTGGLPSELRSLANLEVLGLSQNQLTGTIPAWLGNLANLRELYLWENELTGTIPTELGILANLEVLALNGNQLTGTIPTELGNLANLEVLALNGNQLTGTIPTELGNLANLEVLALSHNEFTGTIPPELGELTNLRDLALNSNQLTGTIPPELRNLVNLEQLSLRANQLTGTIPAWLGSLANLQLLFLSENQLTGSIPPELGSLANLEQLYLSQNQLTGTIPAELASLTNLRELLLNSNQLTGSIPAWLGSLADLEVLYLAVNAFSGCVPEDLRDVADYDFADLGLPFCSLPTVVIHSDSTEFTVRIGSPVPVTATFSEPVSGFTVEDIVATNGTVGNFTGSGGDSVYTFDVTPNAIGTVAVDIAADAAEDGDGNGNAAASQLSLGIPYDDNDDGGIQRDEVISAIKDYFGNHITREDVIEVIKLYFSS